MSAHTCVVDLAGTCTGPGPCDTSSFGAGNNWVNKVGGLPDYIRAIAHSLQRDHGMSESRAISTAVATVKRWAAGGGGVTAATRARAAAALAEWEAKKTAAHSLTAAPAATVDLAEAGHVYHWKHGWIPITPHAALQKAHGSHAGAARILHKNGQHADAHTMLARGLANAKPGSSAHARYSKALADHTAKYGHGGAGTTPTKMADHFRMSGPELRTRAAAGDSAAQKELDRRASRRTAAGGKAGGHRAGVPFRPADETKQPPQAPPVPHVPKQPTTPKAPEPAHTPDPIAQFEQENRQIEAGLPGHTITTRQLTSLTTGAPTRVLHAQYDANGNRIGAVLDRPHGGYRASLHGTHLGDFETRAGAHQALSREHDRAIADAKRKAAEKAVRDTRQAAANAKKAQAVAAGLKGPGGSTWSAFEFRSDGSRAGDKAAAKIKQAFTAGDSTVLIETPLSKEQTRALLEDITAVTDKTGVKGVTFHVPSGDGHFRSRGGITGAYVRQGQRTVFINPKIANSTVSEQFKNSSNFMPANKLTNGRTYTLAHELGHIVDNDHEHTFARTTLGSRQVAFTTPREAITALEREHRGDLSTYGRKNLAEGYAEAYAQWIHGGPGSSKVADAYAHRFGWSVPR